MKFDYTSDLHLDFYINSRTNVNKKQIYNTFNKYFENKNSDYLIIAGDIGHYPKQNLDSLNYIKELFGYKDIFTVEGNHSGYMVSNAQKYKYKNGKNKILDHMKILQDGGIKILDGCTYDIEGSIIGGCNSWYDGSVYYRHTAGWYNSAGGIESHWKSKMNDSKMMNINEFYNIVIEEKRKLTNLVNKCDVMVTHVKPVIEDRFMNEKYKNRIDNAYYSFDWIENIVNDDKLQAWVYGHTHEVEEFDVFGKKLVCNAFGYPKESKDLRIIKTIELV
jgi:predicted phosphodiesterase